MAPTRSSRRLRNRSPAGEGGSSGSSEHEDSRDRGLERDVSGGDGADQAVPASAASSELALEPASRRSTEASPSEKEASASAAISALFSSSSTGDGEDKPPRRALSTLSTASSASESQLSAITAPITVPGGGRTEPMAKSKSGPISTLPPVTKTTRRETFKNDRDADPSHHTSSISRERRYAPQLSPPSKQSGRSSGASGAQSSPSSGEDDVMKVFMPPRSRHGRSVQDRPAATTTAASATSTAADVGVSETRASGEHGHENLELGQGPASGGGLLSCFEDVGRPELQEEESGYQHPQRYSQQFERGSPEYGVARMMSSREAVAETTTNMDHSPSTDPYYFEHVGPDELQFSFDDSPDNSRDLGESDYKVGGHEALESGNDRRVSNLPPFGSGSAPRPPSESRVPMETPLKKSSETRHDENYQGNVDPSHGEGSPSKKARHPDSQPRGLGHGHAPPTPSSASGPPPPQPPPPHHYHYPPQPVYYHQDYQHGSSSGHPSPMVMASPHGPPGGYPYHAAGSPPNMPPPHAPPHGMQPGYPPPPPPGYSQWGSPPSGSPGYYMYQHHPPPPYYHSHDAPPPPHPQQHPHYPHVPSHPSTIPPPHGAYMPPPEPATRTPAKKRDRREDANVTMETADMSLEEETSMVGPVSPPSSKKKKDAGFVSWPAHDMKSDRTPQRGSAHASRSKYEPSYSTATARTSSNPFEDSFGFGDIATPARDYTAHDHWSPIGSGALFEEEQGANQGEMFMQPSSNTERHQTSAKQSYARSPPPRETAAAAAAFTSVTSPIRGGLVIRGSPISVRGQRSAERPKLAQRPMSESKISQKSATTPAFRRFGVRGQGAEELSAEKKGLRTPSSSKFTIKIGSVGREASETRRGIEGINSYLRGSPVSAQRHPPSAPRSVPHPTTRRFGEIPGPNYPPTQPQPYRMPASTPQLKTPSSARKGDGKENTGNEESKPCTCKNSKCLKLYCVCFSAERYCVGCKCTGCQNTSAYENIRQKAINDTRAKNPQAFKAKIELKESTSGAPDSPQTAHSTGCKCRRTACLKKYCECFSGGIVCGDKCKCTDCLNYTGSQALIDRRRRIRDSRGAEAAMKSSDELWKKGAPSGFAVQQSPIVHVPGATGGFPSMMMSPIPTYAASPHMMPHSYPRAYGIAGHSPMGYPQMVPVHQPQYSASKPVPPESSPYTRPGRATTKSDGHQTPMKTTTLRKDFDPRRSKQSGPGSQKEESKEHYFGPDVSSTTRSTALGIFSYLANEDLFNASIVSKKWSKLATDGAIWDKKPRI